MNNPLIKPLRRIFIYLETKMTDLIYLRATIRTLKRVINRSNTLKSVILLGPVSNRVPQGCKTNLQPSDLTRIRQQTGSKLRIYYQLID